VVNAAQKYRDRCDKTKVLPSSFWNKALAEAAAKDPTRTVDKLLPGKV
jgi:hypothetical protein